MSAVWSNWCCGILVSQKNNKEVVCICVNMRQRQRNKSVCRVKFILPSADQTFRTLPGAQYFSKLDMNMDFWEFSYLIIPFGHYHFNCLHFGISFATEHFHNRMVTEVTVGIVGVSTTLKCTLSWSKQKRPGSHSVCLNVSLEKER